MAQAITPVAADTMKVIAVNGQVFDVQISTLASTVFGSGGGGGGSVSAISVSTGTTLTSAAMNQIVICGGSSNYALTLPDANAPDVDGQTLPILMDGGLTALVTVTAQPGQSIDGASARVMWAGEYALLWAHGGAWRKLSGRSIPFDLQGTRASSTFTPSSAWNLIPMDAQVSGPSFGYDSGSGVLVVPRAARYEYKSFAVLHCTSGTANLYVAMGKNATPFGGPGFAQFVGSGLDAFGCADWRLALAAGDRVSLQVNPGNSAGTLTLDGPLNPALIGLLETPAW